MFKKPNRNFRRRRADSSEEDETNRTREGEVRETEEEVHLSAPARLSLHLQQGRGISCSSKRESESSKLSSGNGDDTPENDVSEQTSEAATEQVETETVEHKLKSENKEKEKNKSVLSFVEDKVDENEFKIKKPTANTIVFKAQKKEQSRPADTNLVQSKGREDRKAESSSGEEGDDAEGDEMSVGSDDDRSSKTSSRSNSSESGASDIPDARRIQAARRQRQLARAPKDLISLDTTRGNSPGVKDQEDGDSINEPDDHERRIQFTPKPKTLRQRIAAKIGRSESEEESTDSQEDDDQNLWEKQQIRKGTNIPQISDIDNSRKAVKHFNSAASLPPVNLEMIKKRLTKKLESIGQVHRAHQREQEKIQQDIERAKTCLENLEDTSPCLRYKFYKEMRIYVQNLVDCLSEKIQMISDVESEMHHLLKHQAQAILNRRREEVKEESLYIQQVTNYTSSSNIGHMDSGERNKCLVEQKERRARRSQRNENSENKAGPNDGLYSDDEVDPANMAEFQKKRDDVLCESRKIFDDVHEDFHNIKDILSKFDQWRGRFADSYYDAYIGLCLPKLLGPLICYQLIDWNPLKEDCEDFATMPWYTAVEQFCYGREHEGSEIKDNPDMKMLPSVIERTIFPKIQGFVEHIWEPHSSTQTRCLVRLCRKLEDDYSLFQGSQKKAVQDFVNAVILRMRSSVDEDVFIPLYAKKFLEDRNSLQCQFQDRQFWSAVKLLGNIMLWDGLVPEEAVKELGFDKLLNRYILITLLNTQPGRDSVEKCKETVACFPKSWFKEMNSRSTLPQLKHFSKHLHQTAHTLCKNINECSIREIAAEVVVLLVTIKALDHAEDIIREYQMEDLKTSLGIS
ncbi:GC-rich sequence DNA-binding factor 2-like [Acipenser oxyrinchus oxyrinchus]|uniref:GC-rich sequence DNA-binding factor 2-like n=1 Tax=Acipenser oxyrinchus oxyrinchus TaxID=40147 RepID=A0AAD8LQ58_ACIOX|nr:GC-rich sequence DNA-binding factor 2-like [Acipenser oxyrinchus oxyrinchus]